MSIHKPAYEEATDMMRVIATMAANQTINIGALPTPTPRNINSAATTNSTNIKNTAGTLYSLVASNTSASARYLKLYNKATAPTVGTDIPILTITLNPSSVTVIELGTLGYRFALGLGIGITGLAIDTDTTVIGVGEVKVMASYI